jgi:hypothetical protein
MDSRTLNRRTLERIEDAAREIGTLLIAFAPLDLVLAGELRHRWPVLLLFLTVGALLLGAALRSERGRLRRAD